MFNDLNSSNNQGHSAVDDIFAETDKAQEGGASGNSTSANSGIETKKVGLAANDVLINEDGKATSSKWFKISLIVVIVAIVILGSYLVYSKFFKISSENVSDLPVVTPNTTVGTTNQAPATPKSPGSFVSPTGSEVATTASPTEQPIAPIIPGVNAPATATGTATSTIPEAIDPSLKIDSDNDGLTDAEEKAAGTNINIIDTDNDGLSDYEEVKIYKTNPLSADTDGDSYLDGAEVKSGYNPNGLGKLVKPASVK